MSDLTVLTTPPVDDMAPDVRQFIADHRLSPHIDTAIRLIAETFTPASSLTLEKAEDPEFSDAWVSIRFSAIGDTQSVVSAYRAYIRKFVATVPSEYCSKIRLSLGMP